MKLSKNRLAIGCSLILTSFFLGTPSYAVPANINHSEIKSDEINILADIAVIDKTEILLAVIASNKKASADVMDFAKMMIDQHGSNLTQVLEIANSVHLKSLSSNASNKLTTEGNEIMMKLGGLQGEQFDKAYIDGMVKGHQAALELIDNQLMKKAKTESIKNFLSNTRDAVVQHLDKAKKLQENVKS
ncbi:hypothetical protein Lsan_3110 [Legionella santicrucis]|uniref:DUF4142 domain-containing protein n=1 Tax=Legionella santicrucis TaxID=45074 RepID=A0A0W0YG33_9GAMM|nr:DUF4142 domain-containing protein [Legionella santicrucis]KTD55558.1 hypothetical protein Lsan_3110 [Legionella santicrucis]